MIKLRLPDDMKYHEKLLLNKPYFDKIYIVLVLSLIEIILLTYKKHFILLKIILLVVA